MYARLLPDRPTMSTRSRRGIGQDSRGDRGSRGVGALRRTVATLALLGVALLVVAEFLPLFEVKLGSSGAVLKTVSAGANNNYSLLLIALAAIPFTLAAVRTGSRVALLALAVLGLVAAAIAFLGDLPDAHRTGVVGKNFEDAASSARVGFYFESLGAILLLLSAAIGLLLSGPSSAQAPSSAPESAAADA